jgi:hypothetical protein
MLTDELEGESGTVDPRPATPDTLRAAHNSPGHSRSIVTVALMVEGVTSSFISATTTTRYRVEGLPETWEEFQAARKREEARRTAEAVHIQQEQILRGYEKKLHALCARIVALHHECVAKVERVRRKRERDWAIERGEVAVVVEDGDGEEVGLDLHLEDTEGGMAVDKNYVSSSLTTSNDEDQWPSQPSVFQSKSNFLLPPPLRKTQQQKRQDDERVRGRLTLALAADDSRGTGTIRARVGKLMALLSRCSASQYN